MSLQLDHPFFIDLHYKDWSGVLQVASSIEFGARQSIYTGEFFELELLQDIEDKVGKEKTFIDIGGCMGNHALFFAGPLAAGQVHIFEPGPWQINLISGTLLYNDIFTAKLYPFAAGDSSGTGIMQECNPLHLGGMEFVYDPEGDAEFVRVDETLKDLDELHCIKIDAESCTGIAFEGCSALVEKFKPLVYIEESKFEPVQSTIEETAKKLKYEKAERFGIPGTNAVWRYEPST